ncbi:molybdenum cofactor guanylyltransferase [Melioribacteraceae bacterium 4301-Me]|uniref:molybdenum cofactor guanylyltransferase n=1 Tax=Pyranulibacter aquaticus TaxID=3163344 RepID=UPI00359675D3
MYSDITGVILAGGKSSRMGVNKALLKLGNQLIIEQITDLMKSIFSKVIIITNSPNEYKFLNLPLFEDIYKWKGPLAGIHSALVHSATENIFVLSCDVPFITAEMIKYIVEFKSNKPIKFCEAAGYLQPLIGLYSKSLISDMEQILSNDRVTDKSFHHFLKKADAEIIHPESLSFYKDELFFNVNRPEDYEHILRKYNTDG